MALDDKIKEIRTTMKNLEKIKNNQQFLKMKTRLTNQETGKLIGDIIIYAIQVIQNSDDARNFYNGYVRDIRTNPDKYPDIARSNAVKYAKSDINLTLGLHFIDKKYYKRWEKAIPGLFK